MRKGWKTVKLGDVSDFEGGSQPPKTQFSDSLREGYVRFLQIRDFKSDKHIVYIPISKKNRLCKRDDIMIGRYGASVGQILRGKEGAYNVALIKTTPNEQIIEKNFFYLYLISGLFQKPLALVADRSAQAGFSKADIVTFKIPLPPLPEQKRIVAILDEAFAGIDQAIANTEKNLASARELFESYLNTIFTQKGEDWREVPLGSIFETATGNTPPKAEKTFYGNDIPFVKPPELINGPISFATDNLSLNGAQVARVLPVNSVLVSCIGNLGKIGINTVPVAFNQQINAIKPRTEIAYPEFVFYQTLSAIFLKELTKRASGITVPIVNKSKFNSIMVSIPTLVEQAKIIKRLNALREEVRTLEIIHRKKLALLIQIKQAILQKAFNGELTTGAGERAEAAA